MKTIFTLLMTVGMYFTTLANHWNSDFEIRLPGNTQYTIIFDQEVYKSRNFFSAFDLAPGYHQLKIVKRTPRTYHHQYNGYHGRTHRNHINRVILYNGPVYIDQGTFVTGRLKGKNLVLRTQRKQNYTPQCNLNHVHNNCQATCNGDNVQVSRRNNNHYNQGNVYYENQNNNYDVIQNGNNNNYQPNDRRLTEDHLYNNYNNSIPATSVIHQGEYNRIKQLVKKANFDSDRLRIAKSAIKGKNITTQMAKEMTQLFDFDGNRLKFAKFAYRQTVDQDQYYLMNDVFQFSGNARTLEKHIQNNG